ncbi:MAG: GGDEF domain-containing protein [Pseudomonadota bacterium]
MNMFVSLTNENFRRIFLSFYLLSCLLPMLIMLFIVYQYAVPALTPYQLEQLSGMFNIGTISILLIEVLGFSLLFWWTLALEKFTQQMTHISSQALGNAEPDAETAGNELTKLSRIFEQLHKELQNRMQQAGENARQMQALTQKMTTLACTDDLTQLFNRRHFRQKFTEIARRADRLGHSAWLIRFEVEHLSHLSDKDADHLLKEIGHIVRKTLPEAALPFRIGRNEFAVIISEVDGKIAARTTHALSTAISSYSFKNKSGQSMGKVGISCGIAGHKSDQMAMFNDAGKAMANAQRLGHPIGVAPAA